MRLTWPEIRARAAKFSDDHQLDHYEKGQTQTFYNEFFECFGVDRKQVAVYEQRVKNLPQDRKGFIDLFMPGKLIVEQKSAGLDLRVANDQALDYYEGLPEAIKPRYILTCDFQRFELLDLETRREWRFPLADLKKHVEAFAFIVGVETRQFRNQKPANPKASELLGKLHRQLEEDGYSGHKLQLLLVRLLFILFADDTGIWPKDQFLVWLEQRTQPDGRDLGEKLTALFGVLDTAADDRQASLDADLNAFPHINGALFAERIDTASFNNALRDILLDASVFDWGSVSPAIFGSLFESVIDKVTRRKQGAHYTPEEAIQKVIGPLFLDDLYAEFEVLKARKDGARAKALAAYHDKIAALTFFDPACGAGNFLVVAYREMRELERLLLREIHPPESRQLVLDVTLLSKLNVNRCYGIEIDEFPSQIAQVALWMTDHIANTNLGDDFGKPFARVPLVTAPNIRHGDALEIDWADVLPPAECSYVFGNPPFIGSKMQSETQRAQVRRIAQLGGSGGTLDYVAAWFLKAGTYLAGGGYWPHCLCRDQFDLSGRTGRAIMAKAVSRTPLEIAFAHRTFVWPGRAAVHCVIVGLAQRGDEPVEKRLFSYSWNGKGAAVETRHAALTAYLFDASEVDRFRVVNESTSPLSPRPAIQFGNMPNDDGNLIISPVERAQIVADSPALADFILPLIGAKDFINGGVRYCLWLKDAPPNLLNTSPAVAERIRKNRAYRSKSTRSGTRKLASFPSVFGEIRHNDRPFVLIPRHSSERREYVPMGFFDATNVAHDSCLFVSSGTLFDFALLTSAAQMAWMRDIGGRLESRYRYSIGLVYNTFPWPDATPAQRAKIEVLAQAVLDARALPKNATSTLADLYDPDRMPGELFKAHKALDAAVDRLYAAKGFADDRARVEHLFRLYEALVMPTTAAPAANRRTSRRVARRDTRPV